MTLLKQMVRFALVGVANTGVYYGFYLLLLHLLLGYVGAHLVAWLLAMTFSFWLNCIFTYRVRPTWRKFLAYPLTNVPNAVITTIGVVVLVETFGVGEQLAPLVSGVLAIPATFFVARFILMGRPSQGIGVERSTQ